MFFNRLYNFIGNSPGKTLPKSITYIKEMTIRQQLMFDRYRKALGIDTQAVRLLRNIVAVVNIPRLLEERNDTYRFMNTLINTKDEMDRLFDPTYSGVKIKETFVNKNSYCDEIVIPIQSNNYTRTLPFNQGWDHWKKVRPVRVLDHDSRELTTNYVNGYITFKENHPSYMVIGIDTIALILQYINYLATADKKEYNLTSYFHKYVMTGMIEDLQDIWLRNQYLDLIKNTNYKTSDYVDVIQITKDSMYGYLPGGYTHLLNEVFNEIKNCRNGNVTPLTFLASLRMTQSNALQYIRTFSDETEVEQLKQSMWAEYMKDRTWIQMIFEIYRLQPTFVQTENLMKMLDRDISLAITSNFWSSISRCPAITTTIRTELYDLQERIDTYMRQ